MSDAIEVLEQLGQDASLRDASNEALEAVLKRNGVDAISASAVLSRDQAQLERVLGASANVCCVIMPSDDDEESEKQPDDTPDEDDAS